jgi:hypothetical protein
MEPRAAILDAPAEDWAEVERWSLRAQALAELRALSDLDAPNAEGPTRRTIRLP